MEKKIKTALISVFNKDNLESLLKLLNEQEVKLFSTGGTQQYIEKLGLAVTPVENLTNYPSILGGRVKTLHPSVFGGILGRRNNEIDLQEMKQFNIPEIDLVIVDLYPFEETVASTDDEKLIIEKIDIGGPSMIRAAAKNFKDTCVIASKEDYNILEEILRKQNGITTIEQRKNFAATAFEIIAHYDLVISKYFNPTEGKFFQDSIAKRIPMRYGENPHQSGSFYGNLSKLFTQLNGKELSYNNLVDVDAAIQLIADFAKNKEETNSTFAIIKHTNVCGIAQRKMVKESWDAALAGDPESAFGGVLICNQTINKETAEAINEIFFEVLMATNFDEDALQILKSKKNRILLKLDSSIGLNISTSYKSLLNGVLVQQNDEGNYESLKEVGGRATTTIEREDLLFANIICKHLKSNAIAIVNNKQLIGKGCGQTSRIDSLRQAIEKTKQFNFSFENSVLASDAFFPFDDCVKLSHACGITAFIQPGGSVRDKDSIAYCVENNLAMLFTNKRHFKH